MKALVAVVRREVVERRMVLLAGLLFGILPLFAPLLPNVGRPEDARPLIAMILLCSLAWGIALVLGATVYAKDLADGKLGFYLSRPIPAATAFGGKLLAAFLLLVGAALLVILPTAILDGLGAKLVAGREAGILWALAFGIAFLLLPLANAASTAIRSRNPWIAADFGAAALVLVLTAWSARELGRAGMPVAGVGLEVAIGLLVPVAALAAGFVQAAKGRTDIGRAHRALSVTFWSAVIPVCLVASAGAFVVAHPTPSSLRKVWGGDTTARGDWAFVWGTTRFNQAVFLVDPREPSRFVRVGTAAVQSATFSADGSRAAWLVPRDTDWTAEPKEWEVRTVRLTDARPEVREMRLVAGGRWGATLLLSPSGARLALLDHGTVAVVDVATERTLLAAKVPVLEGADVTGRFVGEETLLLSEFWSGSKKEAARSAFGIWEADIASKQLRRTGTLETEPTAWLRASFDPSGTRTLVLDRDNGASLRDARSGTLVAKLSDRADRIIPSAGFLTDGRIVLARRVGDDVTLLVFDREGHPSSTLPLGPARLVRFGSQPTPETLLVGLTTGPADKAMTRAVVVHLGSGAVLRTLPGFVPAGDWGWFQVRDLPVSSTAIGKEGDVLSMVDALKGEPKAILPR